MNLRKANHHSESIKQSYELNIDEPHAAFGNEGVQTCTAFFLVGLAYAGYVKGSPLVSWIPIDLTLIMATCVSAAWFFYMIRNGRPFEASMRFTALLWLTFLIPGVILSLAANLDMTKTTYLFTTTLLCALLPSVVGNSLRARRAWLFGQLAVGVALGLGVFIFPSTMLTGTGRLDIEGGTTILTSRALGAMAIILVTYAISRNRWRILCLTGAMLAVLTMILIGSRGPFISLTLALPLVVVTAKLPRHRRLAGIGTLAVSAILLSLAVRDSASGGAARLLAFVSGDGTDVARSQLYAIAKSHIAASPLGTGWSGFAQLTDFGSISNSGGYPHNMTLEIFVEGGWIAGIAFIVYAIASLRRLRMENSSYGVIFYGLAIYWLLAAQFSSDINGNRMTWAALAFGFATLASESNHQSRKREKVTKSSKPQCIPHV